MSCKYLLFLILFSVFQPAVSQDQDSKSKKVYTTQRIDTAPVIDGIPDEKIWQDLPVATDFVMVEPGDGTPAPDTHRTEVRIGYTDDAIYVAAFLYDNEPHRIRREFAQRDNLPIADFFLLDINTYNDGENQNRFVVTAAGTLADAKMKGESEDYAFNTVWEAKSSIDEKGWYAEMKIPYSALRFPEKQEQLWSIQLARKINHLNRTYVWNYIDKSVGKMTHYNGLLRGISNVDAPVRLSLYPYVSAAIDHFQGESETLLSAGMDLKYGISDAFTLDATLVPDFGQTAYDEVELNLSPFEQTFGENRAFFTEGTELFSKGDLFYSRRIGDTPIGFHEVQEQKLAEEQIIENPEKTDLLNALKISGRTQDGLGIGFFNAVTESESAVLKNTSTNEIRSVVTEPFANYNILVLDQQLDQKSSVSLINTNVTREGHFRDANVTGFLFDVYNRSSSFNFSGEAKMSHVNLAERNKNGFASTLSLERSKGNFRYSIIHDFANQTYDINDMGLNLINNYNNFIGSLSYRIFEPQGIFNSYNISLTGQHSRRYDPGVETGSGGGVNFFGMTRQRFAFGGSAEFNTKQRDFFEPRREGLFVIYPAESFFEGWISSDYRKTLAIDSRMGYGTGIDSHYQQFSFNIEPRFRVNDRMMLIYEFEYYREKDRRSFVSLLPDEVIFGLRDRQNIENSLEGVYNLSTTQAINLSFRNFWSAATFSPNHYWTLKDNGRLSDIEFEPADDPNANFNIWNLDLSYQWRFAPGSEMILLYRNSLFKLDNRSDLPYLQSLERLFQEPLGQNLSLRIVYYLDYNRVKNIFKG